MNIDDDDFTLFGLQPLQRLDADALDACRRDLQSQVHPDRFASQGATAQRVAMQWAVRVNGAYQRLRNPLTRAGYLCDLRGAHVDAERNTGMPPAFLMQQMEWREALDDADSAAEVQALEDRITAEQQRMFDEVAELLDDRGDPFTAADRVRALMFVDRFRRDIDQRLETLE
ncbi:MAG: Fe-S protein assembly co-chaperone HscB [Rubrivivax sp.]